MNYRLVLSLGFLVAFVSAEVYFEETFSDGKLILRASGNRLLVYATPFEYFLEFVFVLKQSKHFLKFSSI